MKTFIKIIAVASLLLVALMTGCSDRGTNAPYTAPGDSWMYFDAAKHVFSPDLRFQLKNPFELLNMAIYVPEAAWTNQIRVPMLVLLAPQGGDQYYYFQHGLFQMAEEMIRDSVIHPMAIVCVANDQVFGGYFYGNSLPAGWYDSIVGGDLLKFTRDEFKMVYDEPGMRGIGGVGQGAYGAFRAALVHPGTFKSITVTDGPLDFDGSDGTGGFVPQFRAALLEQGLLGSDSAFAKFDSSAAHPISRMLIGAALAFSPHDDSIRYRVDTVDTIVLGDTLSKALRISITNRYQLSDSTTLVTRIVNGYSQYGDLTGFDFHFPFDNTGTPYQGPNMIWQRWMRNNLDSLYWHAPSAQPLDGVQMYFLETPESDPNYGFHEQTTSFRNFLANRHLNSQVWVKEYEGYKGKPATKDQYLYDLLKDMLIFHSHAFYGETQ
ncbi:MAG TPA: hypothetical protein VMS71_05785 [Candidatus Acidoferrum sp.]|nr:hypothetical protein [Candidatus Acidoferrum sp.]